MTFNLKKQAELCCCVQLHWFYSWWMRTDHDLLLLLALERVFLVRLSWWTVFQKVLNQLPAVKFCFYCVGTGKFSGSTRRKPPRVHLWSGPDRITVQGVTCGRASVAWMLDLALKCGVLCCCQQQHAFFWTAVAHWLAHDYLYYVSFSDSLRT